MEENEIIEKANAVMELLGKRTRVVKLLKKDGGILVKHLIFEGTNGKHLVFTINGDYLRSVLMQNKRFSRYTYGLNGQSGTNTKEIFMDFDGQEKNIKFEV